MSATFFKTPQDFRKWLQKNHQEATELVVGYYKTKTGKPSMTWSDSVDQALCFGWIDGIRKSIDEESYCIRFTPRKPSSIWSAININKVEMLIKQGLMTAAGLAAYEKRKDHKSKIYAYENKPKELPEAYQTKFTKNKVAWAFFNKQSVSYQKTIFYWILSAKQETTQLSRLEKVIQASTAGIRLGDEYKSKSK